MHHYTFIYFGLIFSMVCKTSFKPLANQDKKIDDTDSDILSTFIDPTGVNRQFFDIFQELESLDYNIEIQALSPLNEEDFERAKLLEEDEQFINDSILYSSKHFEGDIIQTLGTRNAVRKETQKWIDGKVPYVLASGFSKKERAVIAKAMVDYEKDTCIKFEPKQYNDFDYLYIFPGTECGSLVGKVGGMQPLTLGRGCLFVGIVKHELMHAVGFWHEHSRADRDEYIRVNWKNIEPGLEYNFKKYDWDKIQSLGVGYDYSSVMHYSTHAFAKGFGPTIVPLVTGVTIGQRKTMSETDILKINLLYKCNQTSNETFFDVFEV